MPLLQASGIQRIREQPVQALQPHGTASSAQRLIWLQFTSSTRNLRSLRRQHGFCRKTVSRVLRTRQGIGAVLHQTMQSASTSQRFSMTFKKYSTLKG